MSNCLKYGCGTVILFTALQQVFAALSFTQELFRKFTFCSLYRNQNVQGMLLATVKLKTIKYKIVAPTIIHMHNLHETEDLCIICFRVGLTLIIPVPLKTTYLSPQHKKDCSAQTRCSYTYPVYPVL